MLPGLVDFQNFAQGFGFAGKEAISEAREFWKIRQEGFRRGRPLAVFLITEQNQAGHDCQIASGTSIKRLVIFLQLFRKT